jgi:hypothetical protein
MIRPQHNIPLPVLSQSLLVHADRRPLRVDDREAARRVEADAGDTAGSDAARGDTRVHARTDCGPDFGRALFEDARVALVAPRLRVLRVGREDGAGGADERGARRAGPDVDANIARLFRGHRASAMWRYRCSRMSSRAWKEIWSWCAAKPFARPDESGLHFCSPSSTLQGLHGTPALIGIPKYFGKYIRRLPTAYTDQHPICLCIPRAALARHPINASAMNLHSRCTNGFDLYVL